jgi:Toprim-like
LTSKALSKEQRRLLEKTTLQYAAHLDEAADWLAGRGIDLETARSAGLGVVIDPPVQHYHMRGRLSIPYLTDAGPVAIVARCIQNHSCKEFDHDKMAKPSGQGNLLYGVQSASWADDWIVVTEGEIDALTYHQIGVPALAVPGVKNWKPHWVNVFEDFSRVYWAVDGDDAGDALWERARYETGNAIKMKMPDGEDVNSMYLKQGRDYLLGRIKK